jgi:hypothetical protein
MKEQFLMEQAIVKAIIGPVDLNTGANAGERFDMQKFKRVTFIAVLAAGTTPSSHTFSFQKHDAASAGNSAALEISNPYYHKLNAATEFTKVEVTTAASSFDLDALVGDNKAIVVFEVLAEDVDANTANRWVSMDLTDSGGAQLGCVIAIGHNATEAPAYSKAV